MSIDETVQSSDVFKAIGQLEEATNAMVDDSVVASENEKAIVSFLSILGRIIRNIFEH